MKGLINLPQLNDIDFGASLVMVVSFLSATFYMLAGAGGVA
jgi:hypothetical protein